MAPSPIAVRPATDEDRATILAVWSPRHQCGPLTETVLVATDGDSLCGYATCADSFFERTFISHLFVDPQWRRRSVGTALMEACCEVATSERVFTSTNESNFPMQELLRRLGWTHAGLVDGIDEGDPELFYYRDRT